MFYLFILLSYLRRGMKEMIYNLYVANDIEANTVNSGNCIRYSRGLLFGDVKHFTPLH